MLLYVSSSPGNFSFFSQFDISGVWGIARRGSESIPHTGQPGEWDESLAVSIPEGSADMTRFVGLAGWSA